MLRKGCCKVTVNSSIYFEPSYSKFLIFRSNLTSPIVNTFT